MGIIAAQEDGIAYEKGKSGRWLFQIPCEKCGKIIIRTQYSRKRTYLCDYCKGVLKEKKKVEFPDVRTKHEKRFDKAIMKLQKQKIPMQKYDSSIRLAETACEKYGSIPEAMLAVELLYTGYKIIPQQKIGKYKVDFAIPKDKIIIEVDGELFHENKQNELQREAEIQLIIGFDWKIIHIPSEYINRNVVKAKRYIETIKERDTGDKKI